MTVYERIYDLQGHPSRLQSLYTHLLRTYYNSAIIALFRPFVRSNEAIPELEQESLRSLAIERCRTAASNTTYSLNELVWSDLIDVCQTSLVMAMMSAMLIHFFEQHQLEGLARRHALHNLKLHIMVLDHLRKTYWSADMQHKLFSEALKAMENSHDVAQASSQPRQGDTSRRNSEPQQVEVPSHQQFEINADTSAEPVLGANDPALDDFFVSFNPFNIAAFERSYFTNPSDWVLGSGDVP